MIHFHLLKTIIYFPTRQEGVVRFYVGIRVCDAPTQYPATAARQWILPNIPPEQPASGAQSRQSCSPVDPAQYPARAAGQWIPPSIPPERLANGFRRVSCQSSSPVDPAQYPARAARQWIPPSIPPEQLASGSRPIPGQSGSPVNRQSSLSVDPAEYPSEYPLPVDPAEYPASIEPERLASIRQWIAPVSRQSSSPV